MYEEIALKFDDFLESEKLSGGQNTSYRFGNFALKPIDEPGKYSWMGEVLQTIVINDICIARPLKSRLGNWIEDGFGATEFHPGKFEKGLILEKLRIAEEFHSATRTIPKPKDFYLWSSPWSQAAGVAWQENQLPVMTLQSTRRPLETLFQKYSNVSLPNQFIHSDLAGNILFYNSESIIIDISPDFRPVEYASTMLVTDSIAWHDESLHSIDILDYSDALKKQLILRAVVFRLCVPVFLDPSNSSAFELTLNEFRSVLNYIGVEI